MTLSELLFPNKYRRKVLALLLVKPERWLHLRELARLSEASPGTLKKELDALTHAGLLKMQKVGNQTQFSANPDHPIHPELLALVSKTIGMHDLLATALQSLEKQIEVAFVFGSMANGTDTAGSDVDVMVIGEATFGQVADVMFDLQGALGREINPKVMTRSEWIEKKNSRNPFVLEILNKPKIFLKGSNDEL